MLKRIINLKVDREAIQRVENDFKNAIFALLEFLGFFVGIPLIFKTHPIFAFVAGFLLYIFGDLCFDKEGQVTLLGIICGILGIYVIYWSMTSTSWPIHFSFNASDYGN